MLFIFLNCKIVYVLYSVLYASHECLDRFYIDICELFYRLDVGICKFTYVVMCFL